MEKWYLYGDNVQRMKVPGGWLYLYEGFQNIVMVFVPGNELVNGPGTNTVTTHNGP